MNVCGVWDPNEVDFATCSSAPLCVQLLSYKPSPHSNHRINDLFFSGFRATAQTDPHPSGLFTHVWYISVWSDAAWESIKTRCFPATLVIITAKSSKLDLSGEIYYRNIKSPLLTDGSSLLAVDVWVSLIYASAAACFSGPGACRDTGTRSSALWSSSPTGSSGEWRGDTWVEKKSWCKATSSLRAERGGGQEFV